MSCPAPAAPAATLAPVQIVLKPAAAVLAPSLMKILLALLNTTKVLVPLQVTVTWTPIRWMLMYSDSIGNGAVYTGLLQCSRTVYSYLDSCRTSCFCTQGRYPTTCKHVADYCLLIRCWPPHHDHTLHHLMILVTMTPVNVISTCTHACCSHCRP